MLGNAVEISRFISRKNELFAHLYFVYYPLNTQLSCRFLPMPRARSFICLLLRRFLRPRDLGARAADVAKKDALKTDSAKADPAAETLMCERGKLLVSDDLNQPLGNHWKAAKGKWEVVGGATQGSELKADMHGAVMRTNVPVKNAVIQYSFKLQGAKTTSLSINDAKGHNSRVIITPTGFSARKDDHDHAGPDQAALLQAIKTPSPTTSGIRSLWKFRDRNCRSDRRQAGRPWLT